MMSLSRPARITRTTGITQIVQIIKRFAYG